MIRPAYLRSAVGYFLDRGVSLATGFVLMIAVARCYPPVQVGQFSFAYAIVQTLLTTLTQGLEPYLIRTFIGMSQGDQRRAVVGMGLNIALLTVVFSLLAAAFLAMSGALHTEAGALLLALAGSVVAVPVLVVESYFKAIQRVGLVGVYRAAILIPGLAVKIGLAIRGAPLTWICWVIVAEYWVLALTGLLLSRYLLRQTPPRQVLQKSWETLPGVLSVAGASLLLALYMRSPSMMMPGLSSFADLAGFNLAFQLVQIPAVIGGTALAASYPRLVLVAQSGDRRVTEKLAQRLMSVCVLATYGVAALFFLFGDTILGTIFGARYQAAGSSLWILALCLPISLTGQVRGYLIYINNQPRLHVVNALIGLAAVWSIGCALIPLYLGVGAAIAYTIATAISGWLTSFLFDSTRVAGRMQANAFLIHYPS